MSAPEGFSDEEWQEVVTLPAVTVLLIMASGKIGLIQGFKELRAGSKAIGAEKASADDFLRTVVAGIDELNKSDKPEELSGDAAEIRGHVIALAPKAIAHVRAKAPQSAEAYKAWVLAIAQSTAEAAKEDGGRVSDEEKQSIAELEAALS